MVLYSYKGGKEIRRKELVAESTNSIERKDLEKGLYYVEAIDSTGVVCRQTFAKK